MIQLAASLWFRGQCMRLMFCYTCADVFLNAPIVDYRWYWHVTLLFSCIELQVCDMPSARCSNKPNSTNHSSNRIDQLVSTYSANPSLIAFAKLCSKSWKNRQVNFYVLFPYICKEEFRLDKQHYMYDKSFGRLIFEFYSNVCLPTADAIFESSALKCCMNVWAKIDHHCYRFLTVNLKINFCSFLIS